MDYAAMLEELAASHPDMKEKALDLKMDVEELMPAMEEEELAPEEGAPLADLSLEDDDELTLEA